MGSMYLFSFLLFAPLFILVYNILPYSDLSHRLNEIMTPYLFWLVLLVTVTISFMPLWFFIRAKHLLFPRLKQILTTSPSVTYEMVKEKCNSDIER